MHLLAVAKDDRAKAVPLGLVDPPFPRGDLVLRLGQHRLQGALERKHGALLLRFVGRVMCRGVQKQRDRRRFLTLFGVSVLLHALLLFLFTQLPVEVAPEKKRIELELAWVDTAPKPEEAQPEAPTQPLQEKKKKKTPVASATVQPQAAAQNEGTQAPEETGPQVGTRGDLPLATRPNLTPGIGFIMQLAPAVDREGPRGTTVRNGPGEAPDQRSLNEYTGEVLTRKLNSDLQQEVGLAAVGVGNVPGHFKRYERAMRGALPASKIDRTPMTDGDLARDVAGILFNNGPSAEAARKVADSPLGRSVQNQNVMSPNVDDQRFRESSMQMMAQAENLKERITRARLRTVLEVTTDANGALAEVSIVERSGDPRFDESVLHFSRKVARTLPDNDDKMLGASMWRTRWQFTWEPPDVRVRLLNAWRVGGGGAPQ